MDLLGDREVPKTLHLIVCWERDGSCVCVLMALYCWAAHWLMFRKRRWFYEAERDGGTAGRSPVGLSGHTYHRLERLPPYCRSVSLLLTKSPEQTTWQLDCSPVSPNFIFSLLFYSFFIISIHFSHSVLIRGVQRWLDICHLFRTPALLSHYMNLKMWNNTLKSLMSNLKIMPSKRTCSCY